MQLILVQGVRLGLSGMVLGVTLSWFSMRLIEDMLFEVGRRDPVSLVGIAFLVAVVSLLASVAPGRRATRVPPVEALRAE
jgi:putative ABC transport system permease protein